MKIDYHDLVMKLLNAKISLPTYLWVLSSLVLATYVLFYHDIIAVTPFAHHLPIDVQLWAILLMVGDATCLIGMFLRTRVFPVIRTGAGVSFLCWVFGSWALLFSGGWVMVTWVTGFYIIMYAYLFLGAAQGVFTRGGNETISK